MFIFFLLLICPIRSFSFLASLCPSINGADFKRMFTSRCLCTFCLLAFARSPLLELQVSFYLQRGSNNFPAAMNRTILPFLSKVFRVFSEQEKRNMRKFSFFREISFHSVLRKRKCENFIKK